MSILFTRSSASNRFMQERRLKTLGRLPGVFVAAGEILVCEFGQRFFLGQGFRFRGSIFEQGIGLLAPCRRAATHDAIHFCSSQKMRGPIVVGRNFCHQDECGCDGAALHLSKFWKRSQMCPLYSCGIVHRGTRDRPSGISCKRIPVCS